MSLPAGAFADSEITIIKPRKNGKIVEEVSSENIYLKKINEIQNQEIEKLRSIRC